MIIPPLSVIPNTTFNPPTPSLTDLHNSTNVLINLFGPEGPECADVSRYRTTTDIVLSCLTTILACIWVALHLDVPKSHQSIWQCFWRKFCWMIVALVAPEYVFVTAMEERMEAKMYMNWWNTEYVSLCDPKNVTIRGKTSEQYARELKDKKYDSRWTLTHGFLAGMGGIRRYGAGGEDLPDFKPSLDISKDLEMRPIIQQIGLISCDDIQDKSKGDGMAKFLAVIQTTWFIVQCLARWVIHLPVTELEVVTLAYAVQNMFVYILWWDKPQSLSVPFRLYVEADAEQLPETLSANDITVPLLLHSPSQHVVDEEPNSPLQGFEAHSTEKRRRSIIERYGEEICCLFFVLSGTMFGALHLIPLWLSTFPSDTVKRMWEVSTFYVIVSPLGCFVVILILHVVSAFLENVNIYLAIDVLNVVFIFCAFVVYATARVILLVLSFTTLRSLPKEAFRSVEWTRFIPHF